MSDKKLDIIHCFAQDKALEHTRTLTTLQMALPGHIALELANAGLTLSELF